ncbi:sterol desaturase family protein [Streptomyces hainanensis]|uniref:sterol desaturase family protein n=1 Tax=Streptomyces hainanensis TaxID=402648 RepID=UPI001FB694A2|nr:sterol desaturase family protein [Streptomyces hainanensis]
MPPDIRHTPPWAATLRHLAYPILLGSVVAVGTFGIARDWPFEVVGVAFPWGTLIYLGLLERLIPYQRSWHPTRREWRWYGAYYLLTALGAASAQAMVLALVGVIATPEPALPLGAEIPLALLLGSLANYLVHRFAHTNRQLWRLHGVHHAPDKVNIGNNGVNNIFDVVLTQGITQLSLALVGFSAESVFAVGLFVVAQGYFTHANVDVRIGWFNHLVSSPEQHRLHHSTDLSEAGHFAADLSVWDRVFGTFTWRPGRRPVAVGLADPGSFPATGAVLTNQFLPWRRSA